MIIKTGTTTAHAQDPLTAMARPEVSMVDVKTKPRRKRTISSLDYSSSQEMTAPKMDRKRAHWTKNK